MNELSVNVLDSMEMAKKEQKYKETLEAERNFNKKFNLKKLASDQMTLFKQ